VASDIDLDGDGILNADDPFALDPENGLDVVIEADSPWRLDFVSLGQLATPPATVYEAGFTGLMTVPGGANGPVNPAPSGVALGPAGLTVAAVPAGDAYQNKNSLAHGYQSGIDVSGLAAFVAGTRIANPFQFVAPQNYQAQGLQIGTGSQDNYVKLAFIAKGGAGGVEVAWENDGVVAFKQTFTLDLPPGVTLSAVANIELELSVDRQSGTTLVTPRWRLFDANGGLLDDQIDDAPASFAVTGAVADALAGTHSVGGMASGAAVGLFATSAGATPFAATWETIEVRAASGVDPLDLDGDGILNGIDAFAVDASNGGGLVIDSDAGLSFDFAALASGGGGAPTPYEAGFTGLMTVPAATANGFNSTPPGVTIDANGLTIAAVAGGDAYQAKNSLAHGYQVGVDVSGVPAFNARTVMANPFQATAPQNYQAQGLQIGTGDQNSYLKVALIANGGVGGIEFLWENGGTVAFRKVFTLDLPPGTSLANVIEVEVGLDVDTNTGSVLAAPVWRLLGVGGSVLDDSTDNGVTPIAVTGAVAAAVNGTYTIGGEASGLAVGLYATSSGASPFAATWKTLAVDAQVGADSFDLDGDGILNAVDPFAQDASNGLVVVIDENSGLSLDFVEIGAASVVALTPYEAGFTGLATVPGSSAHAFDDGPSGVAVTAGGLRIAAVPTGDSYQAKNSLGHGYQFGVDVSGVAAFQARTLMANPFQAIVPQNYQAQGLQIGTGDQNAYVKVALIANGGSGAIEVLWENEGSVAYRNVYSLNLGAGKTLADVAEVQLGLEVDTASGVAIVAPTWQLLSTSGSVLDDQSDNVVLPFAVTGAVAAAIEGSYAVGGAASGLAVGLYATSAGTTPFAATWKTLGVSATDGFGSLDVDDDGILNGADAFVQDASNGADFVIAPGHGLSLNFAALGASGAATPYQAGLTGLMAVPGSALNGFDSAPNGVVVDAAGLTVAAVPSGDSYLANNSLVHGYQVGVDVSGTAAFVARTTIANPFTGVVPQSYQAQGLQIGTGDQDSYVKIAFIPQGGIGGVEVLWENAGVVEVRQIYAITLPPGLTLADVATVDLGLEVDTSTGTPLVLPNWRLFDAGGTLLDDDTSDATAPFAVTGAVADAIAGTYSIGGVDSGLAVGLYATSAGATRFEATWKTLSLDVSEGFGRFDLDSDGLLNGEDSFALDGANGFANVVTQDDAFRLDFGAIAAAAGGAMTPYEAGLSGLMTVPGTINNIFQQNPSGATVTAQGLTVAAVPTGDLHQGKNSLAHGYQVGVDVTGVQAFEVRTVVENPFRDTAPTNHQAVGLQIGSGDQNAYVKLAFIAKAGPGGIEVLWEEDGAVAFRQSFTLDMPPGFSLADVADIELTLHVDTSTGETIVTPEWRLLGETGGLIDSNIDDAVVPFAVTGKVAEAIAGTYTIDGVASGLAAGLYATSAATVPFEATWKSLDVEYSEPIVPPYAFSQLLLTGTDGLANPTSLEFGPDGRLYVAERFGGVWSYEVEKIGDGYNVVDAQYIDLVKNMPNHDDSGNLASVVGRQTTGLLVAGTAENPILYVSSSNPVVGGGPAGLDKNIDTNSGVVSRLTWNGSAWEKVDIVRGLPRSEENHSVNGMVLDGDTLYVTVGGNTNQGSPSSKFAFLSEYAYSAAVLKVDLAAIDAMEVKGAGTANPWIYDLPTVDDPTVANIDTNNDGIPDDDPNGVFGGNDGLNMAKIVPGGPVQIFATGYRNPYDIVRTESGKIYVVDNGGNATWGGVPLYDGNGRATNQPNPNENSVSQDSLHLVAEGSHGGHANPTRGNPEGAGLYLGADGVTGWVTDPSGLPIDWSSVTGGLSFENDNISRKAIVDSEGRPIPGTENDGSLWAFSASTNGLTEYTASEFDGAMQGYLVSASYDGRLALIKLDPTGTFAEDVDYLQVLLGNTVPLDVTAQGDTDPFAGTMWIANIGSSQIVIMEPTEPGSVIIDPSIAADVDQDGVANISDAFWRDPNNGMGTTFSAGETVVWDFARDASNPPPLGPISIFGLGFTGIMYNGSNKPTELYNPDNILPSGANPVFQVNFVSEGEANGGANNQENAFQFGVSFDDSVHGALISSVIDNPFDSTTPAQYQSQGIFIGTGSQFDYISVAASQHQGGSIEVKQEVDDVVVYRKLYNIPELFDTTEIQLDFEVNTDTGAVRPRWSYTLNGETFSGAGEQFLAIGDTLDAIQGSYTQARNLPGTTGNVASGLAVGIIGSSVGPAEEFTASWADITVTALADAPPAPTPSAFLGITLKNVLGTSSFTSNSFELVNLPDSGPDLLSVTIDTSTAILPQMVFDPLGTAGDAATPKPFTIDTKYGSFAATASYEDPLDGGFQTLRINLDEFGAGERLNFSIDADPSNIKGVAPPGPADTGAVSGLELAGSTVTMTFADGTAATTRLFKDPAKLAGGSAVVRSDLPPAPVVDVDGFEWGDTVSTASHTVFVDGTPGTTVRVVVAEGGLYLDGVPPGGPAPEGANTFLDVRQYDVAIGTNGTGAVDVLLSDADGAAGTQTGWNYIFAAERDPDALFDGIQHLGPSSDGFLLHYQANDLLGI